MSKDKKTNTFHKQKSRFIQRLQRIPMRWLAILSGLHIFAAASCPNKPDPQTPKAPASELIERVGQFNQYMRWQVYDRAKVLVLPALRPQWMLQWEQDRHLLKIIDYVVRDISLVDQGQRAVVLVVQQRYRLPSVTLYRFVFQQRWEIHAGHWYYAGEITAQNDARRPLQTTPHPTSRPTSPPALRPAPPLSSPPTRSLI